ncbi:hypothetical protein [Saccharothrix deserti]|nr:hypothetical protein [Saccharothrix deserti]
MAVVRHRALGRAGAHRVEARYGLLKRAAEANGSTVEGLGAGGES